MRSLIKVLRETHTVPVSIAETLRIAGGVNRFGESNYRAVWGWSRLDWIGGRWEDRNAAGELVREVIEVRRVPKYPALNRWNFEKWLPPELYGSPEQWHSQTMETADGIRVPALGPYPLRGEYEHFFTLEGPHGEFIQLTPAIARTVARVLEYQISLRKMSRHEYLSRFAEKQDRDYDSWAESLLHDAGPAFYGLPHVSVI